MANIDFLFFLISFKIVRWVLKSFRHESIGTVSIKVFLENGFRYTRGVDEMTVKGA